MMLLKLRWWAASAWASTLSALAALHTTARPLPSVQRAKDRATRCKRTYVEAAFSRAYLTSDPLHRAPSPPVLGRPSSQVR